MRGLNGAAPEQGRAGGLHVLGHGADLRLALHRAGAGDHGEISPADLAFPTETTVSSGWNLRLAFL